MARWLPILHWVPHYERAWLRRDALAGGSVLVLLVPQAMAYASLAGMPPVTGLYAALVALIAYALLGTSSHLSVGPVALISLLTASALQPLAATTTADYVVLAGMLTLFVGGWFLLLAVARAGALVNLLSHPVISGYISAAAIIIGVSQLPSLVGINATDSKHLLADLGVLVRLLPTAQGATAAIGLVSLGVMLVVRRLRPGLPAPLLVVVAATLASAVLDLQEHGVEVVGVIPSGLPSPSLAGLDGELLRQLALAALPVALIAYAESVSVAKAFSLRRRERLQPGQELLAGGAGNLASGLFGGFPVAGSFTRSAVNFEAGARTPLSGLVAAAGVAAVLQVLTGVFYHLPRAVLAGIVIMAVISLVDVPAVVRTFRLSRREGAAVVVTMLGTLFAGVELGLLIGVTANLGLYLAWQVRPRLVELGRVVGTNSYRDAERFPVVLDHRVAIVRVGAPLDFLTSSAVLEQVGDLAAERPEVQTIVLDGSSLNSLDATGLHTIESLVDELAEAGTEFRLATVRRPVHEMLHRSGHWSELSARCHESLDAALAAAGIAAGDALRRPSPHERVPADFV